MRKTRVPRTCERCAKEFEVQLWRFRRNPNEGRFCSLLCHNKAGAGRPSWNKGLKTSEENRQKLRDAIRKPTPPFTDEHKANMRTAQLGRKVSEATREKGRQRMIRYIESGVVPKLKNTLPERIMADLLNTIGIDYEIQRTVGKACVADFTIQRLRIWIEVDGDYWHANPARYTPDQLNPMQRDKVARDLKMVERAERWGWTLIRFWESDLKKRPEVCEQRLRKAIHTMTQLLPAPPADPAT